MEVRRKIRILIYVFMLGLVVSGITALPLESELKLLDGILKNIENLKDTGLGDWIAHIHQALSETNFKYPFMAYGTDWLAFAHFVIAVAFIGPLMDPVRNVWVIEFGMIACVLVLPFAFVAGHFRDIPLGWRLIDCSFGVIGFIPLWYCQRLIKSLEKAIEKSL